MYYCGRSKNAEEQDIIFSNHLPSKRLVFNTNNIDVSFPNLKSKGQSSHRINICGISVDIFSNLMPQKKVTFQRINKRFNKNSEPIMVHPKSFIFPTLQRFEAQSQEKNTPKQGSKAKKRYFKLVSSINYRQPLHFLKKKAVSNKISSYFQQKTPNQRTNFIQQPQIKFLHYKTQSQAEQPSKKSVKIKRFKTISNAEQTSKRIAPLSSKTFEK